MANVAEARNLLAALNYYAAVVLELDGVEPPSDFADAFKIRDLLYGMASIMDDDVWDFDWECTCPVCSADPEECKRAYHKGQRAYLRQIYEIDKRKFEGVLNAAIKFSNRKN